MPFKPVNTNAIDIKKQKGVPHEGTFKGSQQIKTKIGDQTIWNFMGEDGVGFGIYGFTTLNRAMGAIEEGTLVKITYAGTQNMQTKFGMKDVHQVQVEVWTDDGEPGNDKSAKEGLPF